jgi:hypothetical protein
VIVFPALLEKRDMMGWVCSKGDKKHTIFGHRDLVKSDHTVHVGHSVLKVNEIQAEVRIQFVQIILFSSIRNC